MHKMTRISRQYVSQHGGEIQFAQWDYCIVPCNEYLVDGEQTYLGFVK